MSGATLDTLPDALRHSPRAPAFLTRAGRTALTRGDLADRADSLAGALHRRGIRAGDTVALAVRPGPAALAVVLAALRLRARVALVDPSAGPEVVAARLALAEPTMVIADATAQLAAGPGRHLAHTVDVRLPRLADLAPVVTLGRRLPGCAPALDVASSATGVPDRRGTDADALVIFTSGTTASPRAVVHRTTSLSAGLDAVAALAEPEHGRPVVGGTFFVMGPALLAGAPVALPARGGRALGRQQAALAPQLTYLTPPQARDLLAAGGPLGGRFFSGSAPVSAHLLNRLRAAGADEAWGIYALTEAFPVAAVEATDKAGHHASGDLVGTVLAGLRLATPDGQVVVSGPNVCHRYLGADPHDQVATGDLGRLDGDRLVLAGRLKDMVLRKAENIYPGLYEPALHVPGVASALLVGVPAEDGDEELVLLVEPEPGWTDAEAQAALRLPLAGLGAARPDHVVIGPVPTRGRSRKPDRAAASAQVARTLRRAA